MDTGPSFMSQLGTNLKNNAPQMINALGQNYGGAMSGAAKITGGMMKNKKNKQPGNMPSTGPNNPFQKVNFGAPSMASPSSPLGAPAPTGTPMGSPMTPSSPAGMGAPPMGGGAPTSFMNPNMNPGQLSPLWGNYGTQPPAGGMQPPAQQFPQSVPGLNRQVMF